MKSALNPAPGIPYYCLARYLIVSLCKVPYPHSGESLEESALLINTGRYDARWTLCLRWRAHL
jgi:hypothetical protein